MSGNQSSPGSLGESGGSWIDADTYGGYGEVVCPTGWGEQFDYTKDGRFIRCIRPAASQPPASVLPQSPIINTPYVPGQQPYIPPINWENPPPTSNYNPDYSFPGGTDMPSLLEGLQHAFTTVQQTQQQIADSVTGYCVGCTQSVTNVENKIVNQLSNYFAKYSKCVCDCNSSLSQSVQGYAQDALASSTPLTAGYSQPTSATATGGSSTATATSPYNIEIQLPSEQPITPTPLKVEIPERLPTCPPPTDCIKPIYWFGYCNEDTGEVAVDDDKALPRMAPWEFVVRGTDRDSVAQAAGDVCRENESKRKREPPPSVAPLHLSGSFQELACGPGGIISEEQVKLFFSQDTLGELISSTHSVVSNTAEALIQPVAVENPVAGAILGVGQGTLKSTFVQNESILPLIALKLGCTNETFVHAAKALNVLNYWQRQGGIDVTVFRRIYDYAMNFYCRQGRLSPDEALAAFLADEIDAEALDGYAAIAGLCTVDMQRKMMAARSKPVPVELAMMFRRGAIYEKDYFKGMKELGYLDPNETRKLFNLTEQRPAAQELIRFMVRDTDDSEIVQALTLDARFHDKFGPTLQAWAKDIGLTDEQMIHNWRAHWVIPGPQQLFAFWQRERRNAKFGSPDEQRKKIEQALIHNDINPIWFDNYFDVQYTPLGMRQLRMAYRVGTIDDKQLNDGFAAVGFSDESCDTMVEFSKQEKLNAAYKLPVVGQWLRFQVDGDQFTKALTDYGYDDGDIADVKHTVEQGFERSDYAKAFTSGEFDQDSLRQALTEQGMSDTGFTRMLFRLSLAVKSHPIVTDYETGFINRPDAESRLAQYGMHDKRAAVLLDEIDAKFNRKTATVCVNGIKRQFRTGAINALDAVNALLEQSLVIERANSLVESWQCEISSAGKSPSVNQLCNWFTKGVINDTGFSDRLVTLGWAAADAGRLVGDCKDKITAQQNKIAAQQATAHAKAMIAQQKANEKAQAQATKADISKANAIVKAQATKLRREKQLNAVAQYVMKQSACSLTDSLAAVAAAKLAIGRLYAVSPDEILQVMLTTAESLPAKSDCQLFIERSIASAGLLVSERESLAVDLSKLGITNGSIQPSA